MTRDEINKVLAEHALWLSGRGGVRANLTRADLYRADLARANLAGADLAGADLYRADLARANLAGADLTGANGVRWAAIGPVGQGRRMLTAWQNETVTEPRITGGCFHGTFAEFREMITEPNLPWDWDSGTEEQVAKWRRECSDGADLLELAMLP